MPLNWLFSCVVIYRRLVIRTSRHSLRVGARRCVSVPGVQLLAYTLQMYESNGTATQLVTVAVLFCLCLSPPTVGALSDAAIRPSVRLSVCPMPL